MWERTFADLGVRLVLCGKRGIEAIGLASEVESAPPARRRAAGDGA